MKSRRTLFAATGWRGLIFLPGACGLPTALARAQTMAELMGRKSCPRTDWSAKGNAVKQLRYIARLFLEPDLVMTGRLPERNRSLDPGLTVGVP